MRFIDSNNKGIFIMYILNFLSFTYQNLFILEFCDDKKAVESDNMKKENGNI